MSLAVVGLNHRTAPIEVRERFAFGAREWADALVAVCAADDVEEAALLSTCNRTELYLHVAAPSAVERAVSVLAAKAGPLPRPVSAYLYHHRDREAVRHLFRVVSSLDSMVLGEAQIQGQVREGYERSCAVAARGRPVVGTVLHRLFQQALAVGGRVRSETRLGEGAASVPLAAVELARKIFGSLRGRRLLVLGGGEMGELSLRCFLAEGVTVVGVASRHVERARAVAERYGAPALPWERFWDAWPSAEIVVTSSAAPHPVVTAERVRAVLPEGANRPLCVLDIAVPRDVEPEVGRLPNVFLYNVDDLRNVVTANLERRRLEVPRAERMVEEAADEFWRWYAGLRAVPLIRALRDRAEALRREELDRWSGRFAHLSEADRERIDRLTRSLLRKWLHAPTARLREAAAAGGEAALLEAARELFSVDGTGREPGSAVPDAEARDTDDAAT